MWPNKYRGSWDMSKVKHWFPETYSVNVQPCHKKIMFKRIYYDVLAP